MWQLFRLQSGLASIPMPDREPDWYLKHFATLQWVIMGFYLFFSTVVIT